MNLALLLLVLAVPAFAASKPHAPKPAPAQPAKPAPARGLQEGEYARVLKVTGPASVRPLGHQGFKPADAGAILIAGDELKTGPGGVAQLELGGGAILLIGGRSHAVLAGEPEDPIVQFKLGEWLTGLPAKGKTGRRLRISTPQAIASTHGALLWGQTDPKQTRVGAADGEAGVQAAGKTVAIYPGQLIKTASGGAPEEPAAFKLEPALLDRFRINGSLGELEAVVR